MATTVTSPPITDTTNTGSLRHALELLYLLTRRDLKLRYQDTVFGFVWTAAKPLAFGLVVWFALHKVLAVDVGMPYHLFLLSALLPWTLFQTSILLATPLFAHNGALIKKVPFPAAVLPLATIANNTVHFGLSLPVLVVFLLISGRTPGWEWLVGVPLLLALQLVLMIGLVLILSALDVFFRDLEHLIEVVLNLLFYATPILYALPLVPEPYNQLLKLNPLAPLIEDWRELLVNNALPGLDIWPSVVLTGILLITGWWVFSKLRPTFADHL